MDTLRKAKANITGQIELVSQQHDEKLRLADKLKRDVELLSLDRELAEQKLASVRAEVKQSRKLLDELAAEVTSRDAKVSALQLAVSKLEDEVLERKEQCRKQIADEMIRLNAELEQLAVRKREARETVLQDIETERTRIQAEFEAFKVEGWQRARADLQRFEEEIARQKEAMSASVRALLDEAKEKRTEIIRDGEDIALSLHQTAEEKVRVLLQQSHEKVTDAEDALKRERADFRRISHEAEIAFHREKSEIMANLKTMERDAKLSAEKTLSEANRQAGEIVATAATHGREMVETANRTADETRKNAEIAALEIKDQEWAATELRKVEHEQALERAKVALSDQARTAIEQAEKKAKEILTTATEQAQVVMNSVQDDYRKRLNDADDAFIQTMNEAGKKADAVLKAADAEAAEIVAKARTRASKIEATIDEVLVEPRREAKAMLDEAEGQRAKVQHRVEELERHLEHLRQQKRSLEMSSRQRMEAQSPSGDAGAGRGAGRNVFSYKVAVALLVLVGVCVGLASMSRSSSRQAAKSLISGGAKPSTLSGPILPPASPCSCSCSCSCSRSCGLVPRQASI